MARGDGGSDTKAQPLATSLTRGCGLSVRGAVGLGVIWRRTHSQSSVDRAGNDFRLEEWHHVPRVGECAEVRGAACFEDAAMNIPCMRNRDEGVQLPMNKRYRAGNSRGGIKDLLTRVVTRQLNHGQERVGVGTEHIEHALLEIGWRGLRKAGVLSRAMDGRPRDGPEEGDSKGSCDESHGQRHAGSGKQAVC